MKTIRVAASRANPISWVTTSMVIPSLASAFIETKETDVSGETIDVLHNNIGISKAETMETLSVEDWDLIMDTNLRSMFLTCGTVLPHMVRQPKGAIVNISSITALRYARRSLLAYGTSNAFALPTTSSS